MPNAQDFIERARMFDDRAERAAEPISRQHYREMAAHYRALSIEHREQKRTASLQAKQDQVLIDGSQSNSSN